MDDLKDITNQLVANFFKPKLRLSCICGNFRADYPEFEFWESKCYAWTRCECGGWKSDKEREEENE